MNQVVKFPSPLRVGLFQARARSASTRMRAWICAFAACGQSPAACRDSSGVCGQNVLPPPGKSGAYNHIYAARAAHGTLAHKLKPVCKQPVAQLGRAQHRLEDKVLFFPLARRPVFKDFCDNLPAHPRDDDVVGFIARKCPKAVSKRHDTRSASPSRATVAAARKSGFSLASHAKPLGITPDFASVQTSSAWSHPTSATLAPGRTISATADSRASSPPTAFIGGKA
jgi:hypothetical protein